MPQTSLLNKGERDFAIDVLHLLNRNFAQIRDTIKERRCLKDMNSKVFTEIFTEYIKAQKQTSDIAAPFAPPKTPKELDDLYLKLLQLHSNIDSVGKGRVTWDETVMFLIDTTMMGRDSDYTEIMKGYTIDHYINFTETFHAARWLPNKGKLVLIGKHCEVGDFFTSSLPEMRIPPALGATADTGKKGRERAKDNPLEKHTAPQRDVTRHFDKAMVVMVEYLPEHHMVLVSFSDLTLRIYETWRKCKLRRCINMRDTAVVIRNSPKNSTVYCGLRTGTLKGFSMSSLLKDTSTSLTPLYETHPHEDAITEIILLSEGNMVLSSLDGTVSLCDEFCTFLYRITRRHTVGITRMCLLSLGDDGTKFVSTCGYELAPTMWLLQNSDSSPPFCLRDSVQPHAAPVIDVVSVHEHCMPHVVSLDSQGLLKVWNAKNWQCSQTIKCDQMPGINPQGRRWISLCYDEDNKRLSAFSLGQVVFFYYGAPTVAEAVTADDKAVTAFCYDRLRNVIITASDTTLRSWDALSGKLSLLQLDAAPSTISAIAVSDTGRRMYIGTVCGRVTCHNAASAMLIRTLSSSGAEVFAIHYGLGRNFIVVLRWDNTVQIFYETGMEGVAVSNLTVDPRCFRPIEAKCIAFSDMLNRIAVGDRKGFITFFEAKIRANEGFNIIRQFDIPTGGVEIQTLLFLTGLPILLSVDTNSHVVLWALPPHPQPFEALATWTAEATITAAAWYWPKAFVYFATQTGTVITASLYHLLAEKNMCKYAASLSYMEASGYTGGVYDGDPFEIVNTTQAHGDQINFIACDEISRFVVTIMDRGVKLWTTGMQPIGKLDQYQQEMYTITPNYDNTHSVHGDRVCQFREDEELPEAPYVEPVSPLPGAGWLKGPAHSVPPEKLCGWYAAMGVSPLSVVGSEHSKFTQNTFRTTQCHEAIARIRDMKAIDDELGAGDVGGGGGRGGGGGGKIPPRRGLQGGSGGAHPKGTLRRYSIQAAAVRGITPDADITVKRARHLEASNQVRCAITPADYQKVDPKATAQRRRREKLSEPFAGKRLQRFDRSPPVSPNAADYCTNSEASISVPMRAQLFHSRGHSRTHVVRKLERLPNDPVARASESMSIFTPPDHPQFIPVGDEVYPAASLASSPANSPALSGWRRGGPNDSWAHTDSFVGSVNTAKMHPPVSPAPLLPLAAPDSVAGETPLGTPIGPSGQLPASEQHDGAGIPDPAGHGPAREEGEGAARRTSLSRRPSSSSSSSTESKRRAVAAAAAGVGGPTATPVAAAAAAATGTPERPPSGGRIAPLPGKTTTTPQPLQQSPHAGTAAAVGGCAAVLAPSPSPQGAPDSAHAAAPKPQTPDRPLAIMDLISQADTHHHTARRKPAKQQHMMPKSALKSPSTPGLEQRGGVGAVPMKALPPAAVPRRTPAGGAGAVGADRDVPAPVPALGAVEVVAAVAAAPHADASGCGAPGNTDAAEPRPVSQGKRVVVCPPAPEERPAVPMEEYPASPASASRLTDDGDDGGAPGDTSQSDYMPSSMVETFQFLQRKGNKNLYMTIFKPEEDEDGVLGQPDKRGKDEEALERDLFQGTGFLPRELKVQLADQWRQKMDERARSPQGSPAASPMRRSRMKKALSGAGAHAGGSADGAASPPPAGGGEAGSPPAADVDAAVAAVATAGGGVGGVTPPQPRNGSRLAACLKDWEGGNHAAAHWSTMERVYSPLQCLQRERGSPRRHDAPDFDAVLTTVMRPRSNGGTTMSGRSPTPAGGVLRRRASLKSLTTTASSQAAPTSAERNPGLLGIRNIRVAAEPMQAPGTVLAEIRKMEMGQLPPEYRDFY